MANTMPGAPAGLNETQPVSPDRLTAAEDQQSAEHRFQQVQTRAYQLWEEAGRPEGDDQRESFWREAECQLERELAPRS